MIAKKNALLKYGFLDESGEPGSAKNAKDFLVISLVIFGSREEMIKSSKMVDDLRSKLNLAPSYEFHRSKNSAKIKDEFINLITKMDFKFVAISTHKKRIKGAANYALLARELATKIQQLFDGGIKIVMDSNPSLYKELSKITKVPRNERTIFIKQAKSHSDNMLQMADYVVNISAQKLKARTHGEFYFRKIAKKCLVFIELE